MTRPVILDAAMTSGALLASLQARFEVISLPEDPQEAALVLAQHGPRIRGMALRKTPVDDALLQALPALEIISSYSAGLDHVDLDAVRARGITITNTSGVLADEVADLALGLALALARDLRRADAYVRDGQWAARGAYPLGRSLRHMRVGIVGMGTIGQAVAQRLGGLGCTLAYTGPRPKPVPHEYVADPVALAQACDMLILTCPLNDATRHLVGPEMLAALGPEGYLINVARGPVVDEAALIACLAADGLAGAALDVFEAEPEVPQALRDDLRVILAPHIGSATRETRQAMADHMVDSLARHFG